MGNNGSSSDQTSGHGSSDEEPSGGARPPLISVLDLSSGLRVMVNRDMQGPGDSDDSDEEGAGGVYYDASSVEALRLLTRIMGG